MNALKDFIMKSQSLSELASKLCHKRISIVEKCSLLLCKRINRGTALVGIEYEVKIMFQSEPNLINLIQLQRLGGN